MTRLDFDELVERVAERIRRTHDGLAGRRQVEPVVAATLVELAQTPDLEGILMPGAGVASPGMSENEKQAQTYRLENVTADDGTVGDLVLEVKPGGNVHADFEETGSAQAPAPDQTLPGGQAPAGPAAPTETPAGTPEQTPAEAEQGSGEANPQADPGGPPERF